MKKPTLNDEYNGLLAKWAREAGGLIEPQCEECDANLTGRMVYDMRRCWVGDCCLGAYLEPSGGREREDWHADG